MYHQIGGVPAWDDDGYIPARRQDDASRARSPYVVSLLDLVSLFGHTAHRRRLLEGLIEYRSQLHQAGLVRGIQWIDGGFVRNVEADPEIPHDPHDIDVVTLFYLPDGMAAKSFVDTFPDLFDQVALKDSYLVDANYVQLDQVSSEEIVADTAYWYSVWSHTDKGRWKGFLQVDLADDGDELARTELDRLDAEGGAS